MPLERVKSAARLLVAHAEVLTDEDVSTHRAKFASVRSVLKEVNRAVEELRQEHPPAEGDADTVPSSSKVEGGWCPQTGLLCHLEACRKVGHCAGGPSIDDEIITELMAACREHAYGCPHCTRTLERVAALRACDRPHTTSKDCWCEPYQDSQEPTVWIHRRTQ